jgi:CubicO group peptidase (beta-lactamase class C family)
MILFSFLLITAQVRAQLLSPTEVKPSNRKTNVILEQIREEIEAGEWGPVDSVVLVYQDDVIFHHGKTQARVPHSRASSPGPYNYDDPEWHPFYGESDLHTLQSVTKSVMATLIGISLQRGEIESLDQPVASFFDQPLPPGLTVGHLVDMTAGLEWDEESDYGTPGNDWSEMERSGVWLDYVLSKRSLAEPGEVFRYNSGLPQLLAVVLERASGKDLQSLARERLFAPLGIERWHWKKSPAGEFDAQGGLYLSGLSLAKIGRLHLQDGVWAGERILPEGWLYQIANSGIAAYPGLDYSRGWWLMSDSSGSRSVTGIGYRGQRLYILPEQEAVLVFLAWNRPSSGSAPSSKEILERFLPALKTR